MGCVLSSVDHHHHHPPLPLLSSRLFDVYNIDDRGQERSPGKIEVGDEDLVLHQIGKDPIRWPLRSLRRYGFDAELFSFESGRRCATGPGIYAFKCLRAEALFGLLQESIIRAGQLEVNRNHLLSPDMTINMPIATVSSSSPPEWISLQRPLPSDRLTNAGDNSTVSGAASMANDYVNQSPSSTFSDSFQCNYINNVHSRDTAPSDDGASRPDAHSIWSSVSVRNNAELQLPVRERPDVFDDDEDDEAEVFTSPSLFLLRSAASNGGQDFRCAYVNLPSLPLDGVCRDSELGSRGRQYVNIGSGGGSMHQTTGAQQLEPPTDGGGPAVTYAQLDLFGEGGADGQRKCPPSSSSETGPAPVDVESSSSSRTKSDAYASIDFQRTRALSSKVEDELDEGHRKTRHNSTMDSHP